MAVQWITWAYGKDLTATTKFVLVVLADCANQEGYCWPSRKDIAAKTGLSERSVTRAIEDLKKEGILRVEERRRKDGYKTSNSYFLGDTQSRDRLSGDRESRDNDDNSQGTQCPDKDNNKLLSEPSLEPSNARARVKTKKPSRVLPDWLPKSVWDEFKKHRVSLKAKMTELAEEKAIKELEKLYGSGNDPTVVIEQSILNGWKGLFPIKSQGNQNAANRKMSKSERARAAIALGSGNAPFQ